ncbi:ABC transporter permease [Solimonas terrae]|uniref:ABC3 transporter permease C-terminal domain-containing protein n=1 Tax=Solimonas terrae TaxID=1396819 RepID=A0A6M2BVH8_9GAMM|nr:ABC transporter permease [Solimonas terrae]NGY05999.1 hypothetical protein [Solimonas terrae]
MLTDLPWVSGSLARATLVHDWRRFLPAILSVAFAGVLMLVQLGLLTGMFGTVTVLVDSIPAQLWVTAPATRSVDETADIPVSLAALIRSDPDILASDVLSLRDASWRSADGQRVAVTLVALSAEAGAPVCPEPMRTQCPMLASPGSVAVDRSEADKLGAVPGASAEIDGHRVRVVALSDGMRSIGTTYVFTSRQTLDDLQAGDAQAADHTSFVLGRIAAGSDAGRVRDDLRKLLPRTTARVWTRAQLSRDSRHFWLRESGVGAGFLFSTTLGLLIAIVITSQCLRGVILGQLREYAVLRAMGIPTRRLALVVVEQAAWIGAVGTVVMWYVVIAVAALAQRCYVPFTLSRGGLLVAGGIGLATAIGSGLLALRGLYRVEPAELLR